MKASRPWLEGSGWCPTLKYNKEKITLVANELSTHSYHRGKPEVYVQACFLS